MRGFLLFSINLGFPWSLERIFGQPTGSMLGEVKAGCARTAPSPGNPIPSRVRQGFNAEYLLPERQMLVVTPGHGWGHRGAQGGAGMFGGPCRSPRLGCGQGYGHRPRVPSARRASGFANQGRALVPFGSFLVSKLKHPDKRERREGSGLGTLTPARPPGP